MATVTGEVVVLLDVLGCRQGDDRILDAIALVGPDMEVEEFDFDGEKSTYFTFKPAGTDLLFENDVLVSVIMRLQPDSRDDAYGLYPRPAALIDGLSPSAIRSDVTALLGKAERVGPDFDRYQVNERYLHFEFDANDRVTKITGLFEPN